MSWTPERIGELEKLWAEGLSTAEIGRRLGVSKNAVVGKAHRLRLPGRQSPIDPARRQARKAAADKARSAPPKPAARVARPAPETAAKPKPAVAAAKPPPPPRRKRSADQKGPACQWPFGDPRLPGFHFCGAPSEPGKPYCDEHCARAYNRASSSSQSSNRTQVAAA